ncbi:hypothetical protein ACLB1N_19680 [Escherichia coli]
MRKITTAEALAAQIQDGATISFNHDLHWREAVLRSRRGSSGCIVERPCYPNPTFSISTNPLLGAGDRNWR